MVQNLLRKLPFYSLYNTTNLDDLRDSILGSTDNYVAVDTETTGLDWTVNRAFGVSLAWDDKAIFIRNTDFGTENIGTFINDLFASTAKTYVFHNSEFDLHMMRETYGASVPKKILDTQRLSHLIDPRPPHGLKELSAGMFGPVATATEDTIKAYIKQYRLKGYHQVPSEFMDAYAAMDTVLTKALAHIYMQDIGREPIETQKLCLYEHKLIPILLKMEQNGIKIDIEYVNKLLKEKRVEQRIIQDDIYDIVGMPIAVSSNKQLSEYLYDYLKIEPPKETESGQRSVDESSLQKIDHPVGTKVAELVLQWRSLDKLCSTYLEPYKDLSSDRIHPHWNATGARTGRFSSSSPNLQNIPKDNSVRRMFIPDNEYYDFDFAQVELRLMAHFAKQHNMIEAFRAGEDLHSTAASLVFNKTMDAVSKTERQIGKTLNFSVIYGSGNKGIQEKLGLSKDQATKIINHYYSAYPQIRATINKITNEGERNGYVRTVFGRKLPVDPAKAYTATNYLIQGTAADVIKIALAKVAPYVDSIGGKISNTVHDEILFDNVNEQQGEEIRGIMEDFRFDVPLKADLQRSAVSWGDLIDE